MTMNKDFNMDELFDYLAKDDHSQVSRKYWDFRLRHSNPR